MADETSIGIFNATNVAAIIQHKNEQDADRPLLKLFPDKGHSAREIEIRVGTRRAQRVPHTSVDGKGTPVSRGGWDLQYYRPSQMKPFDEISSDDITTFRRADELAKIMAAGGSLRGEDSALMERAYQRLREIGEALQNDLAEEKHQLCIGALLGSVAYTLDNVSKTVSYGLQTIDAPSPEWDETTATIPKNFRQMIEQFAAQSATGLEPNAFFYGSSLITKFDANTEWKDFAKRDPEMAREFLGRTPVGPGGNQVKPGPFGLDWYRMRGKGKNVAGSLVDRWPADKVVFAHIQKAELSWGMAVGNEYNPGAKVRIEIEPPRSADVKTWRCYAFYNGLPVIGSPSHVQVCTVYT